MEWQPSAFSRNEVQAIEEAWQYAIAAMTHFHFHDNVVDLWDNDNPADDDLLVLSPIERLSTPEGYEDRSDIVQEAVRRDSRALVWASDRLRRNGYLWLPVVRRDATVVRYLSKECRDDSAFCREAVRANPNALKFISRHHYYDPEILRAAWQDGSNAYDPRRDVFRPLFEERIEGDRTGSLLRYAVVVFGLDFDLAREVAHNSDGVEDFDRWENDLEVVAAVARQNPDRLADVFAEQALKSSTRSSVDKSPFRPMHKTLGSLSSLDGSGRGRRIRKLSETQ